MDVSGIRTRSAAYFRIHRFHVDVSLSHCNVMWPGGLRYVWDKRGGWRLYSVWDFTKKTAWGMQWQRVVLCFCHACLALVKYVWRLGCAWMGSADGDFGWGRLVNVCAASPSPLQDACCAPGLAQQHWLGPPGHAHYRPLCALPPLPTNI
jgi:hypothetical protein